jgi:8-oxo-dGTP diphosphatase
MAEGYTKVRLVVAAVIERDDRRLLIGQRRRQDTSPLQWEFPGGKVEEGETPEAALARELREELGATVRKCAEIARVRHKYATTADDLEIRFYAVEIAPAAIPENTALPETNAKKCFEQLAWVLPKELSQYDFLAANAQLVANLATGRVKPREVLETAPQP